MDVSRKKQQAARNLAEGGLENLKESLEIYLSTQLDASQVSINKARLLSGGAIQENWLLEVQVQGGDWSGSHRWVLRTDAPSVVDASMSRAQEFAVLQAVFSAGVTAPQPICLCQDRSVIGQEFFVMTAVSGTAAGHVLVKTGLHIPDRGLLCRDLGRSLARLHKVTPPNEGLDFLVPPAADHAQSTIAQYLDYLDHLDQAYPVIEVGLRWLQLNKPPAEPPCLIHRDFRTGNFMVDNGRLSGILDWEFTGWGDWREDIGWFSAPCWRFGQQSRVAGGIGEIDDFFEGYREIAPIELTQDELCYWQVMAVVRWAIIAIQQGDRHRSGQQNSLELVLTGRMLPQLEQNILHLIGGIQ